IWWLITGKVGFDTLAGPVGLTKVVSDVVGAKAKTGLKLITLLNLTALISANLGVINALPFPGLDGFHLLLIVIELLRGGKKVSPKVQNIISYVGLALLIILAIAVAAMDIFKIVG
ncbi:MAG: site-2 protease family protein, partial [Clostridia bacterium]|nr:site-2 protease family protein [Clostridia bacterium]